jgi:hypothetical protein
VTLDAEFTLGIVPHEFFELASVGIMATVAIHDRSGPRVQDALTQGMIYMLLMGVTIQADFLFGGGVA